MVSSAETGFVGFGFLGVECRFGGGEGGGGGSLDWLSRSVVLEFCVRWKVFGV